MQLTNQCIGSYYDELKQRVFYFNWNSNGYNGIYIYDIKLNITTPLLVSFVHSAYDIFGFSRDYPIASINILYRTDEDGDIIHWTDRNNRPMKLNIKDAENKLYGELWEQKYLTVSRKMPLLSPSCRYVSNPSIIINNLKNKIYQVRYQWVYRDDTKSCWSPWSKIFAPINVDDLSTEIDPLKNNTIKIDVDSGDKDVKEILIAARHSLANTYTDTFLIQKINKEQLSVLDNVVYIYDFYNNGAYPFIDKTEESILFDNIPLKANTQELINGNVLAYAGITEGRNKEVTLNVSIPEVTLIQNIEGAGANPLIITTNDTQGEPPNNNTWYYLYTTGNQQIGDIIYIYFSLRDYVNGYYVDSTVRVTHTVTSVVTATFLAGLRDSIAYNTTIIQNNLVVFVDNAPNGIKIKSNTGYSKVTFSHNYIQYITPSNISGNTITDVTTAVYKHKSSYTFGMVYFDEFGVTNGVMTTKNLEVLTPEIDNSTIGTAASTVPNIKFSINHQPPTWAKYFSFTRSLNINVGDFLTIPITDGTAKSNDLKYGYIDITKFNTNSDGWPIYEFKKGDRVRLIGKTSNGSGLAKDYPIIEMIEVLPTAGITQYPATWPIAGFVLKVQYDATTMVNWGTNGYTEYYLEVYTPALNNDNDMRLFYEIGETYKVITDVNNNKVHQGQAQNQIVGTGVKPAIYNFYRGDVYQRQQGGYHIISKSISDKFDSKVEGIGRVFIQDEYAKQIYYPTTIRYSLEYQPNTSINATNKFLSANLDEYDRAKGDIQRLKVRARQMRVFQSRACGMVPILQNMLQTADGNNVVYQGTEIINKIQYYQGEFGIGNQYCSLASSAIADYFTDPIRGSQIRLSQDGMTSISEIYKGHFYLNKSLTNYQRDWAYTGGGKAKILGAYDVFEEEFITCMQSGTISASTIPSSTIGFSETKNAYTSFYDYSPEWICSAGTLIITWKNGKLWAHNNTTTYANFYGVQYSPSIKLVFNETPMIKKKYNTIMTLSSNKWIAGTNGYITTNTGQSSKLIEGDYLKKDDKYYAAFKRDISSTGGLYNGNPLKGSWMEINLKPISPQNLVDLYYIETTVLEPLNNR